MDASSHLFPFLQAFPAIFVLMTRKTTALYTAMWEKIFEIVTELRQNVKTIMVDFELAAINAAAACFGDAQLKGCLFHYVYVCISI